MIDMGALPSPTLPASPRSHTPLPTVCDTTLLGCSAPERVEVSLIPVCCCWFSVTLFHPCMHASIHHAPIRPSCTHPSIICPSIHHVPIYTGTHPSIMHPSIHAPIYPWTHPSIMHPSINFSFLQVLSIHVLSNNMSVGCSVFENIHS